ncbi:MAG: EAL domain-containing protein [Xanthomonadaceae bacterium]|nr:EAL domain-containing protein [Xanthomonadaceae bacterium]
MLLVGGVLTERYADRARQEAVSRGRANFDRLALQMRSATIRRITMPRYGLSGLRSTLAALGRVPTVDEFRQAVAVRDLPREFPGVLGFGFIRIVPDADLPAFLEHTRAAYHGAFQLRDAGRHDTHYVIRSVEPLAGNDAALGFDVGSDAPRRAAVEQALRTGELVVTAPIHLLQTGPATWGALYLLPAYAPDGPGKDRRLLGLVYAAVSYPGALDELGAASGLAAVSLDDRTGSSDVRLSADPMPPGHRPLYRVQTDFQFGHRAFSTTVASLPALERTALATDLPRTIRLGGALVTLLTALLVAEWILRSFRAADLARRMVADNARLAAVGRLTHDAIAITDIDGMLLWVNPAFAHLSGEPGDAALGRPLSAYLHPDEADGDRLLDRLIAARSGWHGEARMVGADGRETVTEVEIQPYTGPLAATTGLVVIQSDITRRRRDEAALREAMGFLEQTGRAAGVGGWQLDLRTQQLVWSAQTCRIHEVPDGYQATIDEAYAFFPRHVRPALQAAVDHAMKTGESWDLELPFVTRLGRSLWVRSMGVVEYENGQPVRLTGALQDITRRKRDELALHESRELLRVTLDSIGDAVVTTDAQARVTWFNPVAAAMIGCTPETCFGRPIAEVMQLIGEETRHPVDNPLLLAIGENRIVGLSASTVLVGHDGTEYGIEDSAAPIRDTQGRVIGGILVFHDVTEARALQREVSERARHDPLTGLANRHEFELRLRYAIQRGAPDGRVDMVFFIDLDHFKLVNDVAGHAAGDLLLCQVASLIEGQVRSRDLVARLGGDEFAVLLEHCPVDKAEKIAQAMCDAIDRYRFVAASGQVFRVGASIGIAATNDATDPINAADSACRAAKESGRNRYHRWSPADEAIQLRAGETAWSVRVEKALDLGLFELFGQRILSLRDTADGLHLEVLLRMRDEDGSLIAPGQFLPAAERFQLINRVDRYVVQRVFELLAAHHHALPAGSTVAVNLSGLSVGDPAFHAFVRGQMERATFDLGLLCLEITETAAITNLAVARTFLQAVRERGVRVALDDFGAGVASFGYLHSLQVDFLKIDGQYTHGMASNPLDMVSMRSFCGVAQVLGVRTIAEAVETPEELAGVRALGIDFAQGYLLHRPEPLAPLLAGRVIPA